MNQPPPVPRGISAAIAIVSATGLAAEIVLMRIFSIVEWHQFAWLIISLALLGFGASGTILAIFRRPALRFYGPLSVILPAVAALTLPLSLALALRIDWRSLELLWNPSQAVNLLEIYLLLAIPFCCIGMFIGLSFMRWPASIGQLYAADLVGAAGGAILAIGLLQTVTPVAGWYVLTGLVLFASLAAAADAGWKMAIIPLCAMLLTSSTILLLPVSVAPGEYKASSQALRIPGSMITAERSSPLGFLQMYESDTVPLRLARGLSLNYFEDLPVQRGVFIDGEGPIVLNPADHPLRHIDQTTFGAALRIFGSDLESAAVGGLAGLPELIRLHQLTRAGIHLFENDVRLIDLVASAPDWGGSVLSSNRVTIWNGELRSALAHLPGTLDLIFIPFQAAEDSLDPTPEATVESFELMLEHLDDEGGVVITTSIDTPPRTVPRLLSVIAAALDGTGRDPAEHVAAIRAWDAATILVSRKPLTEEDSSTLREFADARSFDLVWLPDMSRSEANRFNRQDQPWHHDTARMILASPDSRAELLDSYKFDLSPPTDDRPWFGTAIKWPTLLELLRLREEGGTALIRSGYPILLLALAQALLAGVILILLPLSTLRPRPDEYLTVRPWRIVVTFGALGLAFLFIEIVYIHRLAIILGRPLEATTIVLASFLLFAGLGSSMSRKIGQSRSSRLRSPATRLLYASLAAGAVIILQIPLLTLGGDMLPSLPHLLQIILSVLLIAPLAFLMGIPFPTSLEIVRTGSGERWIAWAWGINGCASVVSAVLAVLLAIHFGLTLVSIAAAILYVVAGRSLSVTETAP